MSLGEERVRTTFNPSSESAVDRIKQKTAELIDLCESARIEQRYGNAGSEALRLWSLAQTNYEQAAMWAVKAATAGVV